MLILFDQLTKFIEDQSQSETIVEGQELYNDEKHHSDEDKLNKEIEIRDSLQVYDDFLRDNPKQGELKIQAFTARKVFPVGDVLVEISKDFSDGRRVFYSLRTDQNGIIDGIILPAPDGEISLHPSEQQPFSTYDIYAEHPDNTPA